MRALPAFARQAFGAVGFVVLLLVPAYAGRGSAVTLRFKYKAGDVYTYQTSGQIGIQMPNLGAAPGSNASRSGQHGGLLNLPINSTQNVKVIKVESNGNAKLEITSSSSGGLSNGQPGGAPSLTTINVSATTLGVLTGAQSTGPVGGAQALSALSGVGSIGSITVYLPAKPISPGDTWSEKVNVPQMPEMATITGMYEKLSQVGRYKTAHIKLTISMPINSKVDASTATKGKAQGEASLSGAIKMSYEDDFGIEAGRLIKSIGTGSTDLNVKQSGPKGAGATGAAKPVSAHVTAKITMTSTLIQ